MKSLTRFIKTVLRSPFSNQARLRLRVYFLQSGQATKIGNYAAIHYVPYNDYPNEESLEERAAHEKIKY